MTSGVTLAWATIAPIAVPAVVSMTGTCRLEAAQSVLNAYRTEIADTTGSSIAESLTNRDSVALTGKGVLA